MFGDYWLSHSYTLINMQFLSPPIITTMVRIVTLLPFRDHQCISLWCGEAGSTRFRGGNFNTLLTRKTWMMIRRQCTSLIASLEPYHRTTRRRSELSLANACLMSEWHLACDRVHVIIAGG